MLLTNLQEAETDASLPRFGKPHSSTRNDYLEKIRITS
jgi:hypothetical protein